jgi:methyl-accepting chemotaxis protein
VCGTVSQPVRSRKGLDVANLRFRLTVISVGLVLLALALGWFAPNLVASLPDQTSTLHLLAATFVFVGLCGVAFYTLMERALNPVMRLIDTFTRMRSGNLNPRLPVEGPEEMRRMAHGFNDMVEDLETQIRDIEVEKQSAERGRQYLEEQLVSNQKFRWTIDAAPLGIVISDPDLKVVYQNPASESGFLQLESFGSAPSSVVGEPIVSLYPDELNVSSILSDPDRLPYDVEVTFGSHHLQFQASATYDEDEEFAGIVLVWQEIEHHDDSDDEADGLEFSEDLVETLDEEEFDFNEELEPVDPDAGIDEEVLAEVEELEASAADVPFEMVDDDVLIEDESAALNNGIPSPSIPAGVERSAQLVRRSVGVLADRLSSVQTTVGALCDEGDSLRRTIEEIKDHAERTGRMTDVRSEPLHDLIDERGQSATRRDEAAGLARSLKVGLTDAHELGQSVDRLRGSIEHLVVSSKIELGRMGEETGGVRAIVDAIGDLGEEARRLGESANTRINELSARLDEVIDLVGDEGRQTKLDTRLETRAADALARIREGLNDTSQRNDLLTEMAQGQAEISRHIASQIRELGDLVALTKKVAVEQVEIVGGAEKVD